VTYHVVKSTELSPGTAFRDIKETKGKLFPSVGMKKAGEHVRVNFGQRPFVFDIDGMMSASNSFSYPHSPILSDTPENGFDDQENGAQSARNPGVPSLGQNTASIEEHVSHREHVPTHVEYELSAATEEAVAEFQDPLASRGHEASPSVEAFPDLVPLETAYTTAEHPTSIEASQEINTPGPVREETLGPFDTFEEAREEGRRRQQEANSSNLDTSTARPYIPFSTLRTRRGYETTLYTWYHPLMSTSNHHNSSASFVTVTPTNEGLSMNRNDSSTAQTRFHIALHDARDVQDILTPPSERVDEIVSSFMEMVTGSRRERRPTISYQDFLVDQRARRGQNRAGRSTNTPNHRQFASRSPHRPPVLSMPGSSRESPHFPGVHHSRFRGREQAIRHQQDLARTGLLSSSNVAEFPPRRPDLWGDGVLSDVAEFPPPRSPIVGSPDSDSSRGALMDGLLSWERWETPPQIQSQESSSRNGDRILHRSNSQDLQDLVDLRIQREITQFMRGQILGSRPAITNGQQTPMMGQNGTIEGEQHQAHSDPDAHHIFPSQNGTDQPDANPTSTTQTTPSGDQSRGTAANFVTILPVIIPRISESERAQAAIESAESAILQAQTARARQSWTIQEIANKLRSLEIRANHSTQREQKQIRQEIEATSTAKLAPPMDETELIQALVGQFGD
jgi:hypothetical protein